MEVKGTTLECRELVERVTDYLEGAMHAEERARFEQHLAICSGCEAYLAQMRATIAITGRLREDDVAPEALEALAAALRGMRRRPRRTALKLLDTGARSAFAGEPWPEGAWIDRENGADGVLVLAPHDLAWWIAAELWEVEIDGEPRPETDGARVPRARLARRIEGWDACRAELVAHCRARARALASSLGGDPAAARLLAFVERTPDGDAATAAYATAMLAAVGAPSEADAQHRFAEERRAQSLWIAARLGLS